MSILYTELLEKLEKYANTHERGIFEAQADAAVDDYINVVHSSDSDESDCVTARTLAIVSLYVRARR